MAVKVISDLFLTPETMISFENSLERNRKIYILYHSLRLLRRKLKIH